jgi:hypothetical protein
MKKIFTLLTLLLCAVTSSWADETIFSWTPKTGLSNADIGAGTYTLPGVWLTSVAGGTAQMVVPANGNMRIRGSQLAFNSSNSYFHITLTKALAKGDNIDINSSGNTNNLWISLTSTRPSEASAVAVIVQGTTYIIGDGNDLIGENEFYVWRASSTTQVGSFTITRISADPASPTIDTDLSTTPIDATVDVGVDLSIEASHVTGYQWYRNSSASTSGATPISGAASASYTFTPAAADAETTVYLYCVVTNENATGTKTATSSIAQVNVGAIPTVSPVTRKIFDLSDWSKGTYAASTILNNLEVKNVGIKENSQTIDGFSFGKYIELPKNGSTTDKFAHFKVNAPCAITVYGRSGSGTRDIQIKIGSEDAIEFDVTNDGTTKKTIYFTGTTETDVYLYTTNTDGAVRVYGITVSNVNVDISAYEWSTYVAEENLVVGGIEGLEAYAITGASGTAITKSDALTTIKAGVPVLLKGTASQKFYLPLAGDGAATPSGNLLIAGAGANVNYNDNAGFNYVLGVEGGKAMFLRIVSGTPANVPVGKAYLALTSDPAGARSLGFDDEVTAIKNIKVGTEDNIYYDLNGRRVLYPKKGLYIVNGKKVIVK